MCLEIPLISALIENTTILKYDSECNQICGENTVLIEVHKNK